MNSTLLAFAILISTGIPASFDARAEDNLFKEIGQDAAKAGKQIGKTAKKVGKKIGKTAKKVGKEIGEGAKDVGKALGGD